MNRIDLDDKIYRVAMMARAADIPFEIMQEELDLVLKANRDRSAFGRLDEYAEAAGFAVSQMCRDVQDAFNSEHEARLAKA